jgi:hypothetical protein
MRKNSQRVVHCLSVFLLELIATISICSSVVVDAYFPTLPQIRSTLVTVTTSRTRIYVNNQADFEDDTWDANVDYEAEWSQGRGTESSSSLPDPSSAWNAVPNMPADLDAEKLGIALDLEPWTQEQAQKLRQDASQVINDAIDTGIQDIERLRSKMNREIEASKRAMQLASDLEARRQQERLLSKIDKLTNNFLQSNEQERKSTQIAAAANRAMEGTGQGLEMGTWGVFDGRTVMAGETSTGMSSLLGSVVNAVQKQSQQHQQQPDGHKHVTQRNRILLIADTQKVTTLMDD